MIFGESLRKMRLARGMSLRQLAREAGISPSYLSDIELGRRLPAERTRSRIVRPLGNHANGVCALPRCQYCGQRLKQGPRGAVKAIKGVA